MTISQVRVSELAAAPLRGSQVGLPDDLARIPPS